MNVGSASTSAASVAQLTRLAVASQAAKRPEQQQSSVAVEAMQLQNVRALAAGSLDTYA